MITIREAGPADLASIGDLLARSGLPDDDIGDGRVEFLVAESDGEIVGTIGLESYPPVGLLRAAAVDTRMRGRGIGRQLVSGLAVRARKTGFTRLVLLTTTAEKFFYDAGFRKIERRSLSGGILGSTQFTGSRCASAAVMAADLAEFPADVRPVRSPPVS